MGCEGVVVGWGGVGCEGVVVGWSGGVKGCMVTGGGVGWV